LCAHAHLGASKLQTRARHAQERAAGILGGNSVRWSPRWLTRLATLRYQLISSIVRSELRKRVSRGNQARSLTAGNATRPIESTDRPRDLCEIGFKIAESDVVVASEAEPAENRTRRCIDLYREAATEQSSIISIHGRFTRACS